MVGFGSFLKNKLNKRMKGMLTKDKYKGGAGPAAGSYRAAQEEGIGPKGPEAPSMSFGGTRRKGYRSKYAG